MTDPAPMALKAEDVAQLLSLSRSQVYALVKEGTLPSIRVGNAVRIPRRALEAWIEERTVTGKP